MFDDVLQRWFTPSAPYMRARWIWLRALGLIFFSAFYSLLFQIHGLIGPNGILPAREYLPALRQFAGAKAYWLAPTLLWIDAGDRTLDVIVWLGDLFRTICDDWGYDYLKLDFLYAASTTMLRNLSIGNSRPPRPTRGPL